MTQGMGRRRPAVRTIATGSALTLICTLAVAGTPATAAGTAARTATAAGTAAADAAPMYHVVQEGLTPADAEVLAKEFGIGNALLPNGGFSYADPELFQHVPQEVVDKGEDEDGRPTVSQALDLSALEQLRPLPDEEALAVADRLAGLAVTTPDLRATGTVSHSELTLAGDDSREVGTYALDTVVSFGFELAGLPVGGQGAKLRLTLAPDGTVTQLASTLRTLERGDDVPVISPEEATESCAALYGPEVRQDTPTLGYQLPELTATDAGCKGTVQAIFPQYTCNPVVESGSQAHLLVPAVPDSAPAGEVTVTRSGTAIEAYVAVEGGTEPYAYSWSSSSTVLDEADGEKVAYEISARDEKPGPETATVTVTDANGLATTASVTLDGDGSDRVPTVPGGGGFGVLAIGPVDVGIEQTVDEWQCAQDSAIGFKQVMASRGVGTQFDWRGYGAWDDDFRDQSFGGLDSSYVDDVDATWYTGHGAPGLFTFKDGSAITPDDARWGNRDLEWLQLESCQVLRTPTVWKESFRGLHILNGFHTNAYCVGGGTGGTFARYLFPEKFLWWTVRPAQTVQRAWALTAIDREPAGVVYRSTGLWRPKDGVTNIGDYFHGQGPVGPDLYDSGSVGMWWISGTV